MRSLTFRSISQQLALCTGVEICGINKNKLGYGRELSMAWSLLTEAKTKAKNEVASFTEHGYQKSPLDQCTTCLKNALAMTQLNLVNKQHKSVKDSN